MGTNPRIRVQRDDAFVLWDEIPFRGSASDEDAGDTPIGPGTSGVGLTPPPEWLRRTICCARWEILNPASDSTSTSNPTPEGTVSRSSTPTSSIVPAPHSVAQTELGMDKKRSSDVRQVEAKVVLAVVATGTAMHPGPGSSLDTSTIHPGRFERADGSLVRIWAQYAGVEVLDVDPTVAPSTPHLPPHHTPTSSERRRSHPHGQERRVLRESKDSGAERESERRPSLVEKPIAMAIVNEQPVKVLRVLARGEKLDP